MNCCKLLLPCCGSKQRFYFYPSSGEQDAGWLPLWWIKMTSHEILPFMTSNLKPTSCLTKFYLPLIGWHCCPLQPGDHDDRFSRCGQPGPDSEEWTKSGHLLLYYWVSHSMGWDEGKDSKLFDRNLRQAILKLDSTFCRAPWKNYC